MADSEPVAKVILILRDELHDDPKQWIEIEEPEVIPSLGDFVSFAGWQGRVVRERDIVYFGNSGPRRQCIVTVLLGDRYKRD